MIESRSRMAWLPHLVLSLGVVVFAFPIYMSFVGSTPIAQYIYETAAAHGKRAQCFGGAKNHAIILPDADGAFAVEQLASAAFGSAGERCMAISAAVASAIPRA